MAAHPAAFLISKSGSYIRATDRMKSPSEDDGNARGEEVGAKPIVVGARSKSDSQFYSD
jgi:hypothetical protein